MSPRYKLVEPVLQPIAGTDGLFILVAPFEICAHGYRIRISEGLQTDGASIPRCLWRVLGHPFQPRLLPGAVTHDALYQSQLLPRDVADEILDELAKRYGCWRIKAASVWAGVRIGGGLAWRSKTHASIDKARRFVTVSKI